MSENFVDRKFDKMDLVTLVCPVSKGALEQLPSGKLYCSLSEKTYPVRDGIARFVEEVENGQRQVAECFDYKWKRGDWGFEEAHKNLMGAFFRDRFCFSSNLDLKKFFSEKTVLHAGVGNGQEEQHYLHHCEKVWGVDISASVDQLATNWANYYPDLARRFKICQADLMSLPFKDSFFDVVLSDGVLHHTPSTFLALQSIVKKVRVGGHVIFYVYSKKAPVREFVDDHIREQIAHMSPQDAWKAIEPLTALAKELCGKGQEIKIPENFFPLGFEQGNFNLQRWMYWNILKFYWNDAFSFDDNNHVNYDWYYPKYCWRHTPEEVRDWLSELNLEENVFNVTESGISVIAKRLI